MMKSPLPRKLTSPLLEFERLKKTAESAKQKETVKSPAAVASWLLDESEDSSLLGTFQESAVFITPLEETLLLQKQQFLFPQVKNTSAVSETDFEKKLIFTPLPYSDPLILREGSNIERLFGEYFETANGNQCLRLLLHLKVEQFHYLVKHYESHKDVFGIRNIDEYCPGFMSGKEYEEKLPLSKDTVKFIEEANSGFSCSKMEFAKQEIVREIGKALSLVEGKVFERSDQDLRVFEENLQ